MKYLISILSVSLVFTPFISQAETDVANVSEAVFSAYQAKSRRKKAVSVAAKQVAATYIITVHNGAAVSPITATVSDTSDTSNVVLFDADIKAISKTLKLHKLPVTIRTQGGMLDSMAPQPVAVLKNIKLYANGVLIGAETPCATTTVDAGFGNRSCNIVFGSIADLNYTLPANQAINLTIKADINDFEESTTDFVDFDGEDLARGLITVQNIQQSLVKTPQGIIVPPQNTGQVVGPLVMFK